jgi:hypothetical protein
MLLNLSTIVNATAAENIVAAHRERLPAAVADAWRPLLLNYLNSETVIAAGASTMSATAAANAASLLLALLTAASTDALPLADQATALDILRRITEAPLSAMSDSQTMALALSAVAPAVIASANASALLTMLHVVENLATAQAANLLAQLAAATPATPLLPPATTSAALFQMLVQVDPPGSSRLTTAPITAPGSPSRFEPMLVGAFAGAEDGVIVTIFFSLAWNPYSGVPTATNSSTPLSPGGVTRLQFSDADLGPIEVANMSVPIRFTLPAVDDVFSGDDALAVCSFWDVAASVYSTAGCAALPTAHPPGHVVTFAPTDDFTVSSDAELVLAWRISGPMVDDGSCFVAVINCSADDPGPYFTDADLRQLVPSHSPGVVYPDPLNPLIVPAVSCPSPDEAAASSRPPPAALRVYYGSACALWQENAYNCTWNNTLQAFAGSGCITDGGPTQCMCRHVRQAGRKRTSPAVAWRASSFRA